MCGGFDCGFFCGVVVLGGGLVLVDGDGVGWVGCVDCVGIVKLMMVLGFVICGSYCWFC